jgi:hypothetical protein
MPAPAFRRLNVRFAALIVALGSALLITQPVVQTEATDALPYAKGFLITGDYAVGSVDLAPASGGGGFLTGTIPMSGVPANADILAAYLYWETISTNASQLDFPKFRGQPIVVAKASTKPLTPSTAPCWSGGSSNASYSMTMFRADVLRLLPNQNDGLGNPNGRLLVNDADLLANGKTLNTVTLPDSGTGNQVPSTAGATLVVVYRDSTRPLTSISVYDGIAVQAPGTVTRQTIAGFLQAAPVSTAFPPRMTQIVGSGANNSTERLYFNETLIATNPFVASASPSSDRAWSARTYDVSSLMGAKTNSTTYGEQVTTRIDHTSTTPYECLAWSAIIFSTPVVDNDQDGLPDKLEDTSGLREPDDSPLPNLSAMGAGSGHKDLLIEVGAMTADAGTTYGGVPDADGHNHLPKPAVLKMIGDAYATAPVANAVGGPGIRAHFDVGIGYHGLGDGYESTEADAYLVPGALARGGELIKEKDCAITNPECQFPGYPGTVSWKLGYQLYRDAPVGTDGAELSAADMDACQILGNCLRRRFDQDRMNFFHYVLYAHSRGKPRSLCLTGTPAEQEACRALNFHVPSSASGIGDFPGGDSLVTLGSWGHGFVGSDFVQASTTMHELGHSFWRTHGGNSFPISEANCKPNYLSVMNYLFQMGGLRDEDGTPHLDYSSSIDGVLNENLLNLDPANANPVSLKYRTGWYAPKLPGTLPAMLETPAATRFCNGAEFPALLPGAPPRVPMARVDFYSATLGTIDWSAGLNAGPPQDVNFDGQLSASLAGANDWADLRLDQIGSRRNMGGFSLGIDFTYGIDFTGGTDLDGGLDFRFGIDFTGGTDADGDFSFGIDFTGGVDFDAFGIDFTGGVDDAYGIDFTGGVDFSYGIDFTGGIEMDREHATALGNTPANKFKACVIAGPGGCAGTPPSVPPPTTPRHRVNLSWKLPNVGDVTSYSAYRVPGSVLNPSSAKALVGGAAVSGTATSMPDPDELPNGQPFTYYIKALFADGSSSGASNFSKIIAVNDAPAAFADSYTVGVGQTLSGNNVLSNDTDSDSPASRLRAVLVTGPSHAAAGFALNANGTFSYAPATGFVGTDTFTYKANDGMWPDPSDPGVTSVPMSPDSNEVTVTITVTEGTPPNITITTPANGGNYVLNSTVLANYKCVDPAPGSGVASCTGNVPNGSRIDTSSVGLKTFTVTAIDVSGNRSTLTNSYRVVYAFTLSAMKSSANLGSSVPVNWQLKDALGVPINNLATLVVMESVFTGAAPAGGCTASTTGTRQLLYNPATGATGGSNLRLVSGGYQFNWDSTTANTTGKGCYTLLMSLNDGSAPKVVGPVQLK